MKWFSVFTFGFGICLSAYAFSANRSFDIMDGTGKLVGQGTLSEGKQGIKLLLELKGAQAGTHAMHIHDKGHCEGPKFETAGGHFNPEKKKHGHKNPDGAHLGDLGNIEIPANGNFKKDFELKGLDLKPGTPHSIATATGSSLVIHAKADDEKTDPSGASGDRIYCGVLVEASTDASSATK
jgi:Cu-Zn family superoxide dismutase